MTRTVAVLGAGRVGGLIASDLAADGDLEVVALDRDNAALDAVSAEAGCAAHVVDLTDDAAVAKSLAGVDAAVVAVPGAIGHRVLGSVIASRTPVVDISFAPEDPRVLDAAARDAGVAAVVDCGVAPGLSNFLIGACQSEFDPLREVVILVGGLPSRRVLPFEYRSVFSPADVIEEYTRPCRMRVAGETVTVPALSDVEWIDFDEVGTLEAFNTDGLRTLLDTVPAPSLREKTLRYPGHAERMRMLRDAGFFAEDPIEVGGTRIAPRVVTQALLFRQWELPQGEAEFTVMRVEVRGATAGGERRLTWDLFDRSDGSGPTSMARTTGYPCAVVTRWLLRKRFDRPGVHPPEILGREAGLVEAMLAELAARGVALRRRDAPASL